MSPSLPCAQVRLMALKDELMEIEQGVVEVLGELIQEFDRNYSELSEANKAHYNAYFTQVRGKGRLAADLSVRVRACAAGALSRRQG